MSKPSPIRAAQQKYIYISKKGKRKKILKNVKKFLVLLKFLPIFAVENKTNYKHYENKLQH